jgi:sugar/nucleoside kinase (ribokinase family)
MKETQAKVKTVKKMKTKYDFIAIGDPTIDTFLFVDDVEVQNVNGQKKAVISWGDKLPVQQFYKTVAGNAANAAVGASRLGLKTAYYAILADDSGGREIIHKMKKEKVATEYIVIDEKHPTNASTVLSHDGERTIFVYHEHRKYKLPKFAPAKFVYLTSLANGFEKLNTDLAKYLDETGAQLIFNPGTFQLRKGVKVNMPMLKRTAILSLNKEEAQSWVGDVADPEELCRRLQKLGPKSIVLTDGRKGAYSYSDEGYFYIPEFPGDRFEATGAGDGFTTAYSSARFYGMPHEQALQWGPVNAGSVVTKVGPQEGLLTKAQLEKNLKKMKTYVAIPLVDEQIKSRIAAEVGKKKD